MREREKLVGGDLHIEGKRKSPPRTAAATKGASRVRQVTPGSIGKVPRAKPVFMRRFRKVWRWS